MLCVNAVERAHHRLRLAKVGYMSLSMKVYELAQGTVSVLHGLISEVNVLVANGIDITVMSFCAAIAY